jgi:hypothetical protein
MPTHAESANRSNTVDPGKLVETIRRWCPGAPANVPITLVNELIEAAASGSSGELRLSFLEEFVLGLAAQLCSNSQKIEKLKKATARMAADPLRRPELRPGHGAELAKAALAAIGKAKDQILSVEKVHTALRRVKPKIRPTSTYMLLKRMTDCGWLERVVAGEYGLPGRSRRPYEPRTLQLLRLVYIAPDHKMKTRQAEIALDWSPKLLSATASELSKRKLLNYEKSVLSVPRDVVENLARGEGVLIAPGKMLHERAGGPLVDPSAFTAFTTLRPERPRINHAAQAQKFAWLRTLKGEPLKIGVAAAAKELGLNPEDVAERLPRSAQRYLRKENAREQWRDEARKLMEQHPERSPKPLLELFKGLGIEGLTREIFFEVFREVAADLLREKGLKTSWSEGGAPRRQQSPQH